MLKRKALLLIMIFATTVIFAACGSGRGRNENGEDYTLGQPEESPAEAPRPVAPVPPVLPPPPTPPPPPPPEHITFESGVLGVKFSVDNVPAWDFGLWSRGSIRTPLMFHNSWEIVDGRDMSITFEFSMETAHPSEWQGIFAGMEPISWGRMTWEHPAEPTSVFVTGHGLTVVEYAQRIYRRWYPDDVEHTVKLFIFRRDGRDYREMPGTQEFFFAMLEVPADVIEYFYDDALAVINSLQFYETAAVSILPTEAARSIGITAYNYPRIDGSTSTIPLVWELFRAMFGESHHYRPWYASRTIPAYELLIAEYVDLILTPDPSAFVLGLAEAAGVELEFIPVAAEALVFITGADNPVTDITMQQILDIYTSMSITNWAELGGHYGRIIPFSRNPHSGSQTLMDNMVLAGHPVHPGLSQFEISGMADMLSSVVNIGWYVGDALRSPYDFGLGYTVYFFLQQQSYWMNRWGYNVNILSLDGIFPSHETILSGEYPLTTNYFAVIRADTPDNHPARKIAEWLLTPAGQNAVRAAGLGTLF